MGMKTGRGMWSRGVRVPSSMRMWVRAGPVDQGLQAVLNGYDVFLVSFKYVNGLPPHSPKGEVPSDEARIAECG